MKVSLNWLKDYVNIDLSGKDISDKLTELGLESTFTSSAKSFTGVVLGKVIECGPHPDANKLSVCQVDIGDAKNYGIVCGAPNVKAGIHVPVATVGAELNNGEYKIKQAKLRGIMSNGMICSGRELSYNNDHKGILIIDTKEKLGTPIENILPFRDDVNFDLDLTPNRGDCLSHLGVSRELGIITSQKIKRKICKLVEDAKEKTTDCVKVNIDVPEACPRYAARVIKGVEVGPSPTWLIERLESIGLKSINNIVDAANYVLMDSGHPMHTFDLDKISGQTINVRFAKTGEKFTTLDDVERKLDDFHMLICDSNKPVALAGIMGGVNSEIIDSTTNVLIESAYFDPTVIRKGAKVLDLSSESSRRFERNTDIDGVIPALDQLAHLIYEIAGGKVLKGVLDEYPVIHKPPVICFKIEKCNSLLGISLDEKEYIRIFKSLQITISKENGNLLCGIPSFRNDLEREVDLAEEVARVVGYDQIPSSNKFSGSFNSFTKDDHALDSKLRVHLQADGFHEHFSNSLMSQNILSHFSAGEPVQIKNPLSQDMSFLRNSIIPGLLMATSYNEKRQEKGFKLFEIGAVHNHAKKTLTKTKEKFQIGILWYGKPTAHWRQFEQRDMFRSKGEISKLLSALGIRNIHYKVSDALGFDSVLKIYSDKMQIGIVGVPSKEVLMEYDIQYPPAICDISLSVLRDIWNNRKFSYKAPPQYPSINRDIAIQIKQNISAQDLMDRIWKVGGDTLIDVLVFDVYQAKDVGDENKSLAFSLKFQSIKSTLKDSEVDKIVDTIVKALEIDYGAVQR